MVQLNRLGHPEKLQYYTHRWASQQHRNNKYIQEESQKRHQKRSRVTRYYYIMYIPEKKSVVNTKRDPKNARKKKSLKLIFYKKPGKPHSTSHTPNIKI